MLTIIGLLVVFGSVLAGFTMAGGHFMALVHPSEIITIGGASMGSLIVMTPKKVLIDLFRGVVQCIKGVPFNKQAYEELFKMLYDLLRLARREGILALESHVFQPHESTLFIKYPKIAENHHVMEFLCGALSPVIEGTVKADQLSSMLNAELELIAEEHHAPQGVMVKTADALPGFGIVAAVLGIVVTMSAINGPVEEIGEKVGAALVGTFLGILLSYGLFAPLSVKMEFIGISELSFFKAIAGVIQGFFNDLPPKVAIEHARRRVPSDVRITRERLDELFVEVEGSG